MAMKTLDEVRNELAELFCSSQTGDDYTSYDLEYYYKSGFDAAIAEMKKRNQVLVDCMEMYKDDHRLIAEALKQYKESVG